MRHNKIADKAVNDVDLSSRSGTADVVGTLLALPVWYAFIAVFVAVTWWCWSLAVNEIAMTRAAERDSVFGAAEQARMMTVRQGLAERGSVYARSSVSQIHDRGLLREIDATDRVGTLPYRVRVRVLSRLERFYAHPPEGDWE